MPSPTRRYRTVLVVSLVYAIFAPMAEAQRDAKSEFNKAVIRHVDARKKIAAKCRRCIGRGTVSGNPDLLRNNGANREFTCPECRGGRYELNVDAIIRVDDQLRSDLRTTPWGATRISAKRAAEVARNGSYEARLSFARDAGWLELGDWSLSDPPRGESNYYKSKDGKVYGVGYIRGPGLQRETAPWTFDATSGWRIQPADALEDYRRIIREGLAADAAEAKAAEAEAKARRRKAVEAESRPSARSADSPPIGRWRIVSAKEGAKLFAKLEDAGGGAHIVLPFETRVVVQIAETAGGTRWLFVESPPGTDPAFRGWTGASALAATNAPETPPASETKGDADSKREGSDDGSGERVGGGSTGSGRANESPRKRPGGRPRRGGAARDGSGG
jgi:hypothetical protein